MESSAAIILVATCLLLGSASCCFPGERLPVDGACKDYMECTVRQEWVAKSCGIWHLFDPVSRECAMSWGVKCHEKAKECEAGKVYPHPDSCRLYYSCVGGRLVLQYCPLFDVFDPYIGKCRFGWGCYSSECAASESRAVPGDCSRYLRCAGGKWERHSCAPLYRYDPVSQTCTIGSCPQCTEGDRRKGADCYSYEECNFGIWVKNKCFWGKRFDPVRKSCVWFFQYSCQSYLSFEEVNAECEDGSCGRGKRSLDSCVEGETLQVDCKRYKECVGGKFVEKSCPQCKNFNLNDGVCSFVWDYPCKGEPTPSPEPTTPSPEPTTPSTEPTTPSTEPSTPSTEPTTPSTEPTTPSTEPTTPSTEPTTPSTEPPTPSTEPTTPSTEPTTPSTEPTTPSTEPTTPSTEPTTPSTEPTTPSTEPTAPSTEPPTPSTEPTTPSTEPTTPSTEPTTPSTEPTTPSTEPTTPSTEPTTPSTEPTTPSTEPTTPSTEPPTTKAPCKNGEKRPNTENCQKYYVCENGKFIPASCGWLRDFDSIELRCMWWGAHCARK